MKKLKDIPFQIQCKHEHIAIKYYDYEFIESVHSYYRYNKNLVLDKVESFLGGKVTDVFLARIAQPYSQYSLDHDWIFLLEKEDGTIEGTFAHCNYKMVWTNISDLIDWLERSQRERDYLLGEEEHNRLCCVKEEV